MKIMARLSSYLIKKKTWLSSGTLRVKEGGQSNSDNRVQVSLPKYYYWISRLTGVNLRRYEFCFLENFPLSQDFFS